MKIGIANDHHGIVLKKEIIDYFNNNNISYVNYGCDTEEANVDYVDYAKMLCDGINNKEVDAGILICGTGIGMSIAANKIKNIRAAKVSSVREAHLAKEHNMANVITLAEYTTDVVNIVKEYLETQNSTEERHLRRVDKINNLS